jgi:acetyl esterase
MDSTMAGKMNFAGLPKIPEELAALMAHVGPRWAEDIPRHSKLMAEQFSTIHATGDKSGTAVEYDIPYGANARQKLDLYQPTGKQGARPALIFVHGGAFVEGDRNRTPEVYGNVLSYFTRHSVVGLNAGYRLAPEACYPEASHDVARVVAWVLKHAPEIGVDPSRIFLMGHSAGAAHAATYAYDSRVHPATGPGIAGLIVVSGRVRADNQPINPNSRKVEAYYGCDASTYDDRSPVSHAGANSPPTMIAWAEFENPLIDVYCLELAHRLAMARNKAPRVLRLEGHNHTSMVAHIGTADERLGSAVLDFMQSP